MVVPFNNKPVRSFIPIILLLGLLWLGAKVLQEFAYTLVWAFIITYVCWPIYHRLRAWLKHKSTLSAALMTAMIAVTFLLAMYWLADMLQGEVKEAYQLALDNMANQNFQLPSFIGNIPWLGHYLQDWLGRLMHDQAQVMSQAIDWGKQWLGDAAKFVGGIGRHVMKLGVILVTVFFCFRDGDKAIKQLQQGLLHFLGEDQTVYLQAAGNTTRAVVYGIVLAALGQGILGAIGYAVAGIKAPVLFGAITALLALVPMGAVLVWLPLAGSLFFTGQVWFGVGLFLWGFLVVSTVDNVIRPIVISGASRVPFLVVLFGVLGGLSAFGMVGLFLGPVILSVLLSVWQVWLLRQAETKHKRLPEQ